MSGDEAQGTPRLRSLFVTRLPTSIPFNAWEDLSDRGEIIEKNARNLVGRSVFQVSVGRNAVLRSSDRDPQRAIPGAGQLQTGDAHRE